VPATVQISFERHSNLPPIVDSHRVGFPVGDHPLEPGPQFLADMSPDDVPVQRCSVLLFKMAVMMRTKADDVPHTLS